MSKGSWVFGSGATAKAPGFELCTTRDIRRFICRSAYVTSPFHSDFNWNLYCGRRIGSSMRRQERQVLLFGVALSTLLRAVMGWTIIGGVYYVIFWFVLYRLLLIHSRTNLWIIALTLIVFMMVLNALTNYVIFRARKLSLSFFITCIFPFMDVALFACLLHLDKPAALSLIPYLLYRLYSLWWSCGLWKLNQLAPTAASDLNFPQ